MRKGIFVIYFGNEQNRLDKEHNSRRYILFGLFWELTPDTLENCCIHI